MSTSTRRDAWSLESTAVPGLNGLIVLNPDGTSVSGAGAGTSDVNIVSIDGTVPTLTIDNLNVQLSHADATPDSVRIGDGTTLIDNDFGVSTAAFRVAALLGNAAGAIDYDAGATGVQTIRTVLETQSRLNLSELDANIGDETDAAWSGSGDGNAIEVLKAIYTQVSGGTTSSASNDSVSTSAVGATFVALTTAAAERVTVVNDTGTDLELRQGGAGVAIPVFAGSFFTFDGVTDADDLEVRRVDLNNAQVTVKYRLES